jgi:hypothetical protein
MWFVSQEMDLVNKWSSFNKADQFGCLYSSAYRTDLRPIQIHAQVHSVWWKQVASKLQPLFTGTDFTSKSIVCVHDTAYVVTAEATQRWWIFCSATEHTDEWYRVLTLYSDSVLSIILEHGTYFNSHTFGLLQRMYSNTKHYGVHIRSVSVFRLASPKTSTNA